MNATVKTFNGNAWQIVTGKIVKRCEKGIVIEDERGIRNYATFDRVIQDEAKVTLW